MIPPLENRRFSDWSELGQFLSLLLPVHVDPQAAWLRTTITGGDTPGRIQAYELSEAEHAEKVELTIERWIEGKKQDVISDDAFSFLSIRFTVVGNLLWSLDGYINYPKNRQRDKILKDFLLDWWRKNGSLYAFAFTISEDDIEA